MFSFTFKANALVKPIQLLLAIHEIVMKAEHTYTCNWTQKHRLIPVILWFAFIHISPLKVISINVVTSWTKYPYWFISF